MPKPPVPEQYLTMQQAADHAGVSRPLVYYWAKQGRLRLYRLGRGPWASTFVYGPELVAFLSRQESLTS